MRNQGTTTISRNQNHTRLRVKVTTPDGKSYCYSSRVSALAHAKLWAEADVLKHGGDNASMRVEWLDGLVPPKGK